MTSSKWEGNDVHILSDSDEDEDEDDVDIGGGNRKGKRPTSRGGNNMYINTRVSMKKVHAMINKMSEAKKKLVREISFGGLLETPLWTKLNLNFAMWLLSKVDGRASSILNGQRRNLAMHDRDVEIVLGIPSGGQEVLTDGVPVPDYVVEQVLQMLGVSKQDQVVSAVEEILSMSYDRKMTSVEKNTFKVAFVIFAVTYILAPHRKNKWASTDYWSALANPEMIGSFNWAGYTRQELLQSASRVTSELVGGSTVAHLTGCLPFLMVYYLDNQDFGKVNKPHDEFPRIKSYPAKVVNELIEADRLSRKGSQRIEYGKMLPREDGLVCYERNPSNLTRRSAKETPVSHSYPETGNIRTISTLQIRSSVLDHVFSYETRCEDILLSSSIKVDEETRRYLNATAEIREESRRLLHAETVVLKDKILSLFGPVLRQEQEPENRKRKKPDSANVKGARRSQRPCVQVGTKQT